MRSGLVVALGLALAAPALAQDGGPQCWTFPANGGGTTGWSGGVCSIEISGDTGYWSATCSGSSCTCQVGNTTRQVPFSASDPCDTSLLQRCCDAPAGTGSTSGSSGTTGGVTTGSGGTTGQACYLPPGNGATSNAGGGAGGTCTIEIGGDTGFWHLSCSGSTCTCQVNNTTHQFAYAPTDACETALLDRCCDAPLASTSSTGSTSGSTSGASSTGTSASSTGSTGSTSTSSASSTGGASTGGASASSSAGSSSSGATSSATSSTAGSSGGTGTSGGGCGCTQADPAGLTLLALALLGLARRPRK